MKRLFAYFDGHPKRIDALVGFGIAPWWAFSALHLLDPGPPGNEFAGYEFQLYWMVLAFELTMAAAMTWGWLVGKGVYLALVLAIHWLNTSHRQPAQLGLLIFIGLMGYLMFALRACTLRTQWQASRMMRLGDWSAFCRNTYTPYTFSVSSS